MIEKLREMMKQNNEINELLQDRSDEFLMSNISIILSALEPNEIKEGYKIQLAIDEEEQVVTWTYVPSSEENLTRKEIEKVRSQYTIPLSEDFKEQYLIDINEIDWTVGKKELVNEVRRIIEHHDLNHTVKKGNWIYGGHHVGKTHFTIALLNFFAKKGKRVAFVNVSDLILQTQSGFNSNAANKPANLVELARKAEILVIDDIGSERSTPWFKENILLPIVDYRFKSGMTTIFSSNSTIDKYASRLRGRSQNPELEEDINSKIIARIRSLVEKEVEVK